MKKAVALIIMVISLLITGCQWNSGLSEPESNLEFWIGENVDEVDFSQYQEKYGLMGGREYYGTGYVPTLDEEGQQLDPEYYVVYTITSYPDYASKTKHITGITITDPSIKIYGLSINSSKEDIKLIMGTNEGFEIEEVGEDTLIARKGDYTFCFSSKAITIRVEVTNKMGIVF